MPRLAIPPRHWIERRLFGFGNGAGHLCYGQRLESKLLNPGHYGGLQCRTPGSLQPPRPPVSTGLEYQWPLGDGLFSRPTEGEANFCFSVLIAQDFVRVAWDGPDHRGSCPRGLSMAVAPRCNLRFLHRACNHRRCSSVGPSARLDRLASSSARKSNVPVLAAQSPLADNEHRDRTDLGRAHDLLDWLTVVAGEI
ncbi:hypothetical protein CSOJ01_10915 [Colletotrichum sojae]|uniref:Uncharacterized protein n=1 Tax=Colletotrichum sojae TaxID=2175907 RepID=A0A8H6IYU4_9PEZI|nr:hypothetical protein CSOJ01_10915 [Colletotrichum sojae]